MVDGHPLFDAETRTPHHMPPPGSWDCQINVYADSERFPPADQRAYDPPPATVDDSMRMHRALGIDHCVIVQATIYRTDHSLLLETLKERPNCRGVAIVDDSVSDRTLTALHDAGVRGARFNFAKFLDIVPDLAEFKRSIERIAALGWHAKIHGAFDELAAIGDVLRALRLPLVIDHMARVDVTQGLDQPTVTFVLDLLKRENWWIMLSNPDRFSRQTVPWRDTLAFAQTFAAAAPDRTIWGSDWPHILYRRETMVNDADLLDWLATAVPDAGARRRILVDNPARLFDASPA